MQLVIAEKPSVGAALAAALGANKREGGYFIGNGYIVSWCIGHLVGLSEASEYDERYKSWKITDLPIIPDDFKLAAAKDKVEQIKSLKDLMSRKDVTNIVNACDAGREGELIFRLVYEFNKCKLPIKRLWISSMEESAIKAGFASLADGVDYDNLYAAALCRSKADWLVGINATRLFSSLYDSTLNVGRVMSPTLALVVQRKNAICDFVKEPLYAVELHVCADEHKTSFTAVHELGKLKDEALAKKIASECLGEDNPSALVDAIVTSIENTQKHRSPPKLFDLTSLQRDANRIFGYTAQQTLTHAQALYEKKILTYPRTDSKYLPEDMESSLSELVDTLCKLYFADSMSEGDIDDHKRFLSPKQVINNAKITDHHAIIPTPAVKSIDIAALPIGEADILRLTAIRLIAAMSPRYEYLETIVKLKCNGHIFIASGATVINDGFTLIEKSIKPSKSDKSGNQSKTKKDPEDNHLIEENYDSNNQTLPPLSEGEILKNAIISIKEGSTSPPRPYTEDTLLSAMEHAGAAETDDDVERKGLGTPATRAAIIEKLIATGFIERKGKQILPCEKGENIIKVLPEMLKSPLLTAEWENRLKEIERGDIPESIFMKKIDLFVREIISSNSKPLDEFKTLFPKRTSSASTPPEVIGKCPRCENDVVQRRKGFFCINGDCKFALWAENKFFEARKKTITKAIAEALLKDGRAKVNGLYSVQKDKTYDAIIVLDDTGEYVNFKMEFLNSPQPKKKG